MLSHKFNHLFFYSLSLSHTHTHTHTHIYIGSVWALSYDHERRILFSGGLDQVIVVWDIGSQQGTAYELTGHT